MREPTGSYPFLKEYWWLREKIEAFAPSVAQGKLDRVMGVTRHYDLPDFRMEWRGVRLVGLFPRPRCVQLLLEYDKFLAHREAHDPGDIDRFQDAAGAIITNRNRLLSLRSIEEVEEHYVDIYLEVGMRLLLAELVRRHPNPGC
jgi:hypothetical protein